MNTHEHQHIPRRTLLIEADTVCDAADVDSSPGALLIEEGGSGVKVLASGAPASVGGHSRARDAERIALGNRVVIPALVNAHAHLDLTHIPPIPFNREGGFRAWVDYVRAGRLADDEAIAASVREGVRRSVAGGVFTVGDIAGVGSLVPAREFARSGLHGVSFVEFFGVGVRQEAAIETMHETVVRGRAIETERVRVGVQPHAPYSAGHRLYRAAAAMDSVPMCTHLAETPEERAFVATADGPMRRFLEEFGVWDDSVLTEVGRGETSVRSLRDVLEQRPVLAAHLNDVSDEDMDELVRTRTHAVYCPRCSDYFGRAHNFGAHRYRDMLAHGMTVALGTDSVINLHRDRADRLSPVDEMALLLARDGTPTRMLLSMATLHGLRALGINEGLGSFEPGAVGGVIAMPGRTLDEAVRARADIEWIVGKPSCPSA